MGGSFDPIHLAHLYIAENTKEKLHLDKVILIPAGSQPLKIDKKVTRASLRFNMVEKAIEGYDGFEVSDYEIKKQGLSSQELEIAERILDDLRNALGGK